MTQSVITSWECVIYMKRGSQATRQAKQQVVVNLNFDNYQLETFYVKHRVRYLTAGLVFKYQIALYL